MLLDPRQWNLASRSEEVLAALPEEMAGRTAAETHGSALELATDPHADIGVGDRRAARPARAARRRARAARDARRGGGHAPVHAVGGRRGLPRRALPVPLLLDARARAARADLRAARARRGAEPGAWRCAPTTACARTCRCCSRCRATRRSGRAATPGCARCARRSSRRSRASGIPREFRSYGDYVEGDRHAAALRRVPRADVPVVGRAAAAALRHARRCASWTRRRASATPRRSPRSCSAWCAWRRSRGTRGHSLRDAAGGARGEPLHRRARRHGGGARSTPRRERRRPAREWLEELLDACAPHAADLGCVDELDSVRDARAPPPGRSASARAPGAGPTPQLGPADARAARGLHHLAREARHARPLMCGIAGELRRDAPPDREALARMSDVLAPRGPDGARRVGRRVGRARPPAAVDHRPVRARRAADGRRRARARRSSSTGSSTTTASCGPSSRARATRSSRTPTPRCC